jgi:hypothetical protein
MGRYHQKFRSHPFFCFEDGDDDGAKEDREMKRDLKEEEEERRRRRSGHDFKFVHPMHEILLEVVFCCCVPPVPFAMQVWKAPDPTRSSPGVLSEEEGIEGGTGDGPFRF